MIRYLISKLEYPPNIKVKGKWSCSDKNDTFHLVVHSNGYPHKSLIYSSNWYGDKPKIKTGYDFFVFKRGCGVAPRKLPPLEVTTQTEDGFIFGPNILYEFEFREYSDRFFFEFKNTSSGKAISV